MHNSHSLITLFLTFVLDGAFRFTQEPRDPSYFKKGSNATLVWDYSVDNQQTELQGVIWSVLLKGQSNVVPMLVKEGDADAFPHPNIPSSYKGRVYIKGRATLVIVNITLQDKTQFHCTLSPKGGSGLSIVNSYITLSVTGTNNHFHCCDSTTLHFKLGKYINVYSMVLLIFVSHCYH